MKDRILTVVELLRYGWQREFRSISILLAAMVVLGLLIGIVTSNPALAPFIYSLF